MKLKKSNNFINGLRENSNIKTNNKKNIYSLDTPMKIYNYHNRVHMIQKKINKKVKEEHKNIEKNLSKITTNFHSLTSRNFYKDYKKFSDKYFKTTNLIDNIADKYHEKGYIIPNLNHDFFKVNPLLDSNINKLFISYLFNQNGKKVNYEEFYEKNKGIKYIKKLIKLVTPEKNKEEKEHKKKKSKNKKLKHKKLKIQKTENRLTRVSENGLTYIRNIHNYTINKESSSRKNNSNRSIVIYNVKGNFNERYNKNKNNFSLFNKDRKSKINRSKSINNTSTVFKTERSENRYDTKRDSLNQENKLYLNLPTEQNKVRNSSNNLTLINTYTIINNIKNSSKNNKHLYLKDEKKSTNNTGEYILDTPQNKLKNKIDISSQNKSSNTKPFSSNNTEKNYSYNQKYQSSKANSFLSFKIKDFSSNSKKTKNSPQSKKNVIIEYNNKITSYPKIKHYTYYNNKNKKENSKFDNVIKDASISSKNVKKLNLTEKKEGAINKIYKQLKAGKYENIENKIKNYLYKNKKLNDNEAEHYIKTHEYKNLKSHFFELKRYINEKKISKKIERIYLNNHDYNRIEPLLGLLNNKEKQILRFENHITKIYNNS